MDQADDAVLQLPNAWDGEVGGRYRTRDIRQIYARLIVTIKLTNLVGNTRIPRRGNG